MAHPLEKVIRDTDRFVVIGDSREGRFPAQSFHNYFQTGKPFYCLDLGGRTRSRGATRGEKVYPSVDELPDDRADLYVIWVKPKSAVAAVNVAHEAGAKRVWFSFQTGHRDAVARARELGMEIVEIGRCPVHYLPDQVPACRAHTILMQLTGAYRRPPQLDPDAKRREVF